MWWLPGWVTIDACTYLGCVIHIHIHVCMCVRARTYLGYAQEMTEFMDNFDEIKGKQQAAIADTERNIVHILEAISRQIAAEIQVANTNSQDVASLARATQFKEEQLGLSRDTYQRLQDELAMREAEVVKVKSLDQKIHSELDVIKKKIVETEEAIMKYSDVDGLREEYAQKTRDAVSKQARLTKLREALKQQVHLLSSQKYDALQKNLTDSEIHTSLEQQEKNIRLKQQSVFGLSDFIAQRSAETDYHTLKNDCTRLVNEVNTHIIDQLNPLEASKGIEA